MRQQWTTEVFSQYFALSAEHAIMLVLVGGLGAAGVLLFRRRLRHVDDERQCAWLARSLVLVALAVGLWLSLHKASVVDDAFISFRYVRNLLDGQGLVWNPGERVEGYTNFLWVMLLALGAWLTPVELPLLAIGGCLLAYAASVLVLARLERRLFGVGVPLAAVLFAVQGTTTDYATTGMETAFATLCVLLGLQDLLSTEGPRRAAGAGSWFIAATLTHPDHALFWGAGAVALVVERRPQGLGDWRQLRFSRAEVRVLAAYTATLLPYVAYLAWKYAYYGDIVPNTYHAKSAGDTYFRQGGIYTLTFLLGAHLWVIVPLAVAGFLRPTKNPPVRRLRVFALASLPIYHLYVAKVGGDFMYGRLFLVTLPLWLLLARRLLDGTPRVSVLVASLLATTAGGVNLFKPEICRWYVCDESANYRVIDWSPRVEIEHSNWRAGVAFNEHFAARGILPVLCTSGIGMVGYYSGLELVDYRGLTDRHIGSRAVKQRGMPGHEKKPDQAYLEDRNIGLIRGEEYHPNRWRRATEIDLGTKPRNRKWHFFRYSAALAVRLKEEAPEIRFELFEGILDQWIAGNRPRTAEKVAEDVAFFEWYYFCCNDDPARRERVQEVLDAAQARTSAPPSPAPDR